MRRILKSVLFYGALVILVSSVMGCATAYRPPVGAETATLTVTSPVWLVSVDGQRVPAVGFTGEKHVTVSTGNHSIEVRYSGTELHHAVSRDHQHHYDFRSDVLSDSKVPIRFTAETGHTYYVQAGRSGMTWKPFVAESREPIFQKIELR